MLLSQSPDSPLNPLEAWPTLASVWLAVRRPGARERRSLVLAGLLLAGLPGSRALAAEPQLGLAEGQAASSTLLGASAPAGILRSGLSAPRARPGAPAIAQAPGTPSPSPAPAISTDQNPETPQQLQSEEANLARQLTNPVASLISVPFQFNYDSGIGVQETIQRANLNIQPVVPFRLSSDWNLISRTILPVVNFQGTAGPETGQLNFGDTVQSLFLSPVRPGPGGLIWGAGPVALLGTATGQLSGIQQWGLGPTGVALVQRGQWTMGALANHLWSVANNSGNANLNATFVQPFLSYTTTNAWTFSLNTESTYDWAANQWAVPLNLVVSKVTKLGNQLLSVGAGVRYWAEGPDNGPKGWGGRLLVTLLFPTR